MSGSQSIDGLVSGLDTTSIIEAIIQSESYTVNDLEQDKALKTQQVAAYRAVLAKFLALKTSASQLRNEVAYRKGKVSVSDDTILTATADGTVGPGTYSMRVLSLARNHQIAARGFDDPTGNIFGTGNIKLSTGDGSIQTITIAEGANSLVDIKDAINEADAGLTAAIINDGSTSNPYRLLLTSDESGVANSIKIDVDLAGGETLDFSTSSFDNPELVSFSAAASSEIALAGTASYTGDENKTYTFTIGGSGEQTVGSDIINVTWSDGTNEGTILVTEADGEVELIGDGADGLTLSFSAGTLVAGDTFQVSTFSPLLQEARDGQIAIGDDTGAGSAIVITSDSNTFEDVIPGVTINTAKVTDAGETVTIDTDVDIDAVKEVINTFIDRYNDVMTFIEDQFTYNQDTQESGVLFAETTLQSIQSSLRFSATSPVPGLSIDYTSLAMIGIRSDADGNLKIADAQALRDALEDDLDSVIDMFTDTGTSTNTGIEFTSLSYDTAVDGDFDVDITRVAEKGYFEGAAIENPGLTPITLTAENNVIRLKVDGVISEDIVLTERTYTSGEELAEELQTRITADETLGAREVTVEWIDEGDTGYLRMTSGSYGSSSNVNIETSISNTAYTALGLAGGMNFYGVDVEGTINGESATGNGQTLTGDDDNLTTDGLKLKVTLTQDDMIDGTDATLSIVRGLATIVDKTLDNITKNADGTIARRTGALETQIDDLDDRIEYYMERLENRRMDLYEQYQKMESVLAEMQATSSYLNSQLASINSNWEQIMD